MEGTVRVYLDDVDSLSTNMHKPMVFNRILIKIQENLSKNIVPDSLWASTWSSYGLPKGTPLASQRVLPLVSQKVLPLGSQGYSLWPPKGYSLWPPKGYSL